MEKHRICRKKVHLLWLCLMILSSLMCACQTGQVEDDSKSAKLMEVPDTTDNPEWKTAYLTLLEEENASYHAYALVHIDGDPVPELYLSGASEATGDCICTYKNGTLMKQQLNRTGGGQYVAGSGIVLNQNGKMGQVYTDVYKLDGNGFALTFQAFSSERMEILENEEYKPCYEYSIGDQLVNEAEHNAAVNAAFDFDHALHLDENSVEYGTICQQISSYGGR